MGNDDGYEGKFVQMNKIATLYVIFSASLCAALLKIK